MALQNGDDVPIDFKSAADYFKLAGDVPLGLDSVCDIAEEIQLTFPGNLEYQTCSRSRICCWSSEC
jgi:hypothetical protein